MIFKWKHNLLKFYRFAHLWDSSKAITWGSKPWSEHLWPWAVQAGGNPHCTEAQASQQHGRSYTETKLYPSCPDPPTPTLDHWIRSTQASKIWQKDSLLASQGMGSKMEDAHPSGVKWQPWIRYSLLRMTRLAKTGNYPNAINSRREKNFDAIYSQSGISYTSENGKKY